MNLLYLSDFYLSDHRLLESLGRALKSSGELFIILPDGRNFAARQNKTDVKALYEIGTGNPLKDQENLISLLTGSILKPMVNFLSEGMAPAIAFAGHQKKLVQVNHSVLSINKPELSLLTGGVSHLVLLATASSDGKPVLISPVSLAGAFSMEQVTIFYLDEILPPDGISTLQELEIWAASEQSVPATYFWISEWKARFPVTFLNLAGLHHFSQKKGQFLTIEK